VNNQTIIDVRTPIEFMGGHVPGSINIPLHELPDYIDSIKNMKQPIFLCCASGNRSARATAFLLGEGIACEDHGSWVSLNHALIQITE
jgi:rhodanese-related sulfurtransferase